MVTSASTFIITRCLPRSMAASPISAPTAGTPVASTTTSMRPLSSSAFTSEVMAILPLSIARLSSSVVLVSPTRSPSP